MPPVQEQDADMRGNGVVLSDGWDVVVAADAIPSERYAADEFRRLMAQASGIELPIMADTHRPDRHVLINHSFHRQLRLEDYAETPPEYFAEIDGARRTDVENAVGWHGTQPCLTNPDVLRIITKSVMEDLRRQPDTRCISVSMNDNLYNCRCSACAELDEAAGSAMGTLLTFVNSVADAVALEFSNDKVGTLAYIYSRKPAHLPGCFVRAV